MKGQGDPSEEIEILLRHQTCKQVIQVHEVYDGGVTFDLIFEYCAGGELLQLLQKRTVSEREAAEIMLMVTSVVYYLHSNGVVHRDLQPSNILYRHDSCTPSDIVIIDFGFAKQMRAENGLLMTPCYTERFVAPEIIKKQGYDEACDIWNLGVIMYVILCGHTPFAHDPSEKAEVVLQRINESQINLNHGV